MLAVKAHSDHCLDVLLSENVVRHLHATEGSGKKYGLKYFQLHDVNRVCLSYCRLLSATCTEHSNREPLRFLSTLKRS